MRAASFESFNHDKLAQPRLQPQFVQGNVSSSTPACCAAALPVPNPQGKYVSVVEGEVWDVAVDIRRGSPHFGRWTAVVLSAENKRHFWIPEASRTDSSP
jgi:dTDP-4-dehydrorhamnose 3,5-epimerase